MRTELEWKNDIISQEHLNITCCPFIPESTINEALQLCPKLKHFELELNTNIYIENYKEPYKWSNSESTSSDSDDETNESDTNLDVLMERNLQLQSKTRL
ncbi:11774_t:CDS:2 [Entrophospora sp. SA101]|nr:11410_t:CDS:2 [Entrophospora sp. SA101]CAJ0881558.1 11774_t:CDS:2 [Entrophospora sp. SA101]